MIIRPSDRALSDDEWRALLQEEDFGTLIVPGVEVDEARLRELCDRIRADPT